MASSDVGLGRNHPGSHFCWQFVEEPMPQASLFDWLLVMLMLPVVICAWCLAIHAMIETVKVIRDK